MTERSVLLMIVVLAVRVIVNNVEVRRGEWLLARAAGEACLVPSASQAAIGGLH